MVDRGDETAMKIRSLRSLLISVVVLAIVAIGTMAGCGGGGEGPAGGGGESAATTAVTIHYASGRIHEAGAVFEGTSIKTGRWTTYFDQADGQKQWEGTYVNGSVDPAQPWVEWNSDSSIRVHWQDR